MKACWLEWCSLQVVITKFDKNCMKCWFWFNIKSYEMIVDWTITYHFLAHFYLSTCKWMLTIPCLCWQRIMNALMVFIYLHSEMGSWWDDHIPLHHCQSINVLIFMIYPDLEIGSIPDDHIPLFYWQSIMDVLIIIKYLTENLEVDWMITCHFFTGKASWMCL
jgi:hypothetical protein